MIRESFPTIEAEPEEEQQKTLESILLDEDNPEQKSMVEDIFNRMEENVHMLNWVQEKSQQQEIVELIAEYGKNKSVSEKEKIRERISVIVNGAYDKAHDKAENSN